MISSVPKRSTADPLAGNGLDAVERRGPFLLERWTWVPGAVPQETHVHGDWQICEYLNEPGFYIHGRKRHAIQTGQFALIAPGEPHRPYDEEVRLGARYRVWHFPDSLAVDVARSGRLDANAKQTVWKEQDVSTAFAVLARWQGSSDEAGLAAESIVARLLGAAPKAFEKLVGRVSPEHLERAWNYLRATGDRRVSLAEVAAAVGLGSSQLGHAFKTRYGLSPMALSLRMRTDQARLLLLRGVGIAEAAAATGFADQPHLTRCFRRFVGATPASYKKAAGSFKTTSLPSARIRP